MIFDMDGVLINSEPLWRKAMIAVFGQYGMPATEDECRQTMGMRFREVIQLWLQRHRKPAELTAEIETRTLDELIALIHSEGRALEGVHETLAYCGREGHRVGLATSSSHRLMDAILDKLNVRHHFHAVVSAEHLRYGKPHPEVFLLCASQLGVMPQKCMVIEDSLNGVIAAKAASMKVIAIPDDEHLKADRQRVKQFTLADHRAANMLEALDILKTLKKPVP